MFLRFQLFRRRCAKTCSELRRRAAETQNFCEAGVGKSVLAGRRKSAEARTKNAGGRERRLDPEDAREGPQCRASLRGGPAEARENVQRREVGGRRARRSQELVRSVSTVCSWRRRRSGGSRAGVQRQGRRRGFLVRRWEEHSRLQPESGALGGVAATRARGEGVRRRWGHGGRGGEREEQKEQGWGGGRREQGKQREQGGRREQG